MNYASWPLRVGGYLIDLLVLVPFYVLALVIDGPKIDADTLETSGGGAIYWLLLLIGFALNIYNRWIQAGKTGQSWGRKAVGITLLGEATGKPIGAGMAFARDLAHIVDSVICYIGWLFPLWDSKRQTLADKIVKTVVTKG